MSLPGISFSLKPLQLAFSALRISVTGTSAQKRHKTGFIPPRRRLPAWLHKQERSKYEEDLTPENDEFIQEVICDTYGPMREEDGIKTYMQTPLKKEPLPRREWFPKCKRSGLIGIKLGTVRQWLSDGKPVMSTLIQIVDNHVIKYTPPEEVVFHKKHKRPPTESKYGHLLVGSISCDPQKFTKEYNGLFTEAGVMPKKLLKRFRIHPDAAIQPGTPLYASHFKIGEFVDVYGLTSYRGFQGVMKRWGFHGQPASHGATKTHRRPGNIGGAKAKVWRGTKMPGCVGYRYRSIKGLQILRINHKYNVLYLKGTGIPGDVNSFVYVNDTVLPTKRLQEPPNFPTYYPEDHVNDPLPNEEFDPSLFDLSSPSVVFEEEKVTKKK